MSTRKHNKKHHGKKMHGKGFFDVIKKIGSHAMDAVNFVKKNGLASKALNAGAAIASHLGKSGIAGTLSKHADTAKSFGAGRKRKRAKEHKSVRYSVKNPTMKAEIADMDNNNRLSGSGRKKKHGQHGKGPLSQILGMFGLGHKVHVAMKGGAEWYDQILPTIASIAGAVGKIAPMFAGGKEHHGGALNLAGSGMPQNHIHEQNYHHLGHNASAHRSGHHFRGAGILGNVNRGQSRISLA